MYGIDKRHASRKRWRTPEVRLQGIAVVGSLGARVGMYIFRHKTWYFKFKYGIPVIEGLQVGIAGLVFNDIYSVIRFITSVIELYSLKKHL